MRILDLNPLFYAIGRRSLSQDCKNGVRTPALRRNPHERLNCHANHESAIHALGRPQGGTTLRSERRPTMNFLTPYRSGWRASGHPAKFKLEKRRRLCR